MCAVLKATPFVISKQWSSFARWLAITFDVPVARRDDEKGWALLSMPAANAGVLSPALIENAHQGHPLVLELEVSDVEGAVARAAAGGAEVVGAPGQGDTGDWHASIVTPQGVFLWLWQDGGTAEKGAEEVVNQGPIQFTVTRKVAASPARVFEAITTAELVEQYFPDEASGDLAPGAAAVWTWEDHGSAELNILDFEADRYVAFRWKAFSVPYQTRVQFAVRPHPTGAEIAVTESGWDDDPQGFRSAFEHCNGWTQFAEFLRAFLERGLLLRESSHTL